MNPPRPLYLYAALALFTAALLLCTRMWGLASLQGGSMLDPEEAVWKALLTRWNSEPPVSLLTNVVPHCTSDLACLERCCTTVVPGLVAGWLH